MIKEHQSKHDSKGRDKEGSDNLTPVSDSYKRRPTTCNLEQLKLKSKELRYEGDEQSDDESEEDHQGHTSKFL